jgi:hypothetical protein
MFSFFACNTNNDKKVTLGTVGKLSLTGNQRQLPIYKRDADYFYSHVAQYKTNEYLHKMFEYDKQVKGYVSVFTAKKGAFDFNRLPDSDYIIRQSKNQNYKLLDIKLQYLTKSNLYLCAITLMKKSNNDCARIYFVSQDSLKVIDLFSNSNAICNRIKT